MALASQVHLDVCLGPLQIKVFILSEPKLEKWAFGFYGIFLTSQRTVFFKNTILKDMIWLS